MKTDADVIIAGAGPAGSLAAYELAIHGVNVLILEKSIFPRYKVCGAGLTHKILHEIPFDVSSVFDTTIHSIQFSCDFKDVFTRNSREPMMYCTMREKLDAFLLDMAKSAGARVQFGEKVKMISQTEKMVEVTTHTGLFHASLVIGADGVSSAVSRSADLRDNISLGLAWEAEVKVDPEMVKKFSKTVFLDWGTFPGGYGWVFPKDDHFSIGVGGPVSLSKYMMPYYQKFLRYLDTGYRIQDAGSGFQVLETISLKSWPIPICNKKSNFHHGKILVAGDAGGLTDPMTGEGIFYAVRSGKLAAVACFDYLQGKSYSLERYTESINQELMNELLEANRIKNLFNMVPLKIHHLVRDKDHVWRAFGKVLRGERLYSDVRKGFGKWKFLWSITCCLSKWVSDYKEKHFNNTTLK
ncbi:MAG: geranylgeranyl reductase family protein [Bacteroidales bacterium]|jgi:geranylgeranyl reductase family protein|nr:geranylgeranyl reductase family protein [Bacteroidales bacterium]